MMDLGEWFAAQNIPEGEKHGHWHGGAWQHLGWMVSMGLVRLIKNTEHTEFSLQHHIAFSKLTELRVDTSPFSDSINLFSQECCNMGVALHELLPQGRHLEAMGFLQLCILEFKIIALLSTTITEMALCNPVLRLSLVRRVVLVGHGLTAWFWSRLQGDFSAERAIAHSRVIAGTLRSPRDGHFARRCLFWGCC
jgi:hypothetical protein